MIAFSVSNVAFSFATKDERRSVFSLDIMGDRPFLYATAASIATIVLMTEFGLFRRILDTTNLNLDQWVDLHHRRPADHPRLRDPQARS